MINSDQEKEKLLYEAYFTGKHLQGHEEDKQHKTKIMEEYKKIVEAHFHDNSIESTELNQEITITEINEAISRQVATDKATDLNYIHPCILKKLGPFAINALKVLFNGCLESGQWIWDTSLITFIKKQGKSSYANTGAFRPLALSSYIGKILERILDSRLRRFITEKELLDKDQEGFIAGKSTTRYLFHLLGNLTEIKHQKLAGIILFIDFEKAYDSVHLPSLIVKLKNFGITGKFLQLIHAFLFKRKVKLKVNDFVGLDRICLLFGLPQGSAIAPFLFILYITDMLSDLPAWIKEWVKCFKFADDGTIIVVHDNMHEAYRMMQCLCNELGRWCQKNSLVINCQPNKTEAIILKTQNKSFTCSPPNLVISGSEIKYVKSTKVLGIILDEDLSFKAHAEQKAIECGQKWNLITKTTNRNYGLNVCSLLFLFRTTVLSKVTYAAPTWLWNNLSMFNQLWNSIIMKISGAMLYPHRMITEIALHLPPLKVQLEVHTVKFLCKVLCNSDAVAATLLQMDGSLCPKFHQQLSSLKKYIMWKSPSSKYRRISQVDLYDLMNNKNTLKYDKRVMAYYGQHLWLNSISNTSMNSDSYESQQVTNVIEKLRQQEIVLCKGNNMFNHKTTKKEDSHILDYIHGNSLLFGSCRAKIFNEDTNCYFCNSPNDTAQHQLLYCSGLSHETCQNLIENTDVSEDLTSEVLVPTTFDIQIKFIDRIKFLIEQHAHMLDAVEHEVI